MLECDNHTVLTNETAVDLLNFAQARDNLPVVVALVVLMTAGVIGNSLVCYIYYFRFKPTSANVFITWLAVVDLISCFVGIPFEILDLLMPYKFPVANACSVIRFSSTATVFASGLTLIAVAFDRYYKITQPLRRFRKRTAKICNVLSMIIGVSFALPALYIFGRNEIIICLGNNTAIIGLECSENKHVSDSKFPLVGLYYSALAIMFVFSISCFLSLYGILGVKIISRRNTVIGENIGVRFSRTESASDSALNLKSRLSVMSKKESSEQDSLGECNITSSGDTINKINAGNCDVTNKKNKRDSATDNGKIALGTDDMPEKDSSPIVVSKNGNEGVTKNAGDRQSIEILEELGRQQQCDKRTPRRVSGFKTSLSHSESRSQITATGRRRGYIRTNRLGSVSIRAGRVTCIFICVTAVFVISFLPYVMSKIVALFTPGFSKGLAYNFAARSFFLNSAANPIIYSFLHETFQSECFSLLRRLKRTFRT